MNDLTSKGIIIFLLCIFGVYLATPWNIFSEKIPEQMQTYLPPDYRFGLDLQG